MIIKIETKKTRTGWQGSLTVDGTVISETNGHSAEIIVLGWLCAGTRLEEALDNHRQRNPINED